MATGASSRAAVLDGWRAVAALLVLFFHTGFNIDLHYFPLWGFQGVNMFFVLSGYLMIMPFATQSMGTTGRDCRTFYIRRFIRIYPAYLVALLVYTVARHGVGLHPPDVKTFLLHAFLIFNFFETSQFYAVCTVFWSLAIEAQFYLILPIMLIASRSLIGDQRVACTALAIAFIVFGLILRGVELRVNSSPQDLTGTRFRTIFSYLDLFGWGMLTAAWSLRTRAPVHPRWHIRIAFPLGAALVLLANVWCLRAGRGEWQSGSNDVFLLFFPSLICGGFALLLAALIGEQQGFVARILGGRVLSGIGRISYSIYLFHILVQVMMFKLVPLGGIEGYGLRTFCWGLISLFPVLLVSGLAYALVERPSQSLSDSFRTRRSTSQVLHGQGSPSLRS